MLLIGYRVDKYAIKFFCTGKVVIIKYIFWRNTNVKRMTILHKTSYTYVILFHWSMHTPKKAITPLILAVEKEDLLFRLETPILQMFNCP